MPTESDQAVHRRWFYRGLLPGRIDRYILEEISMPFLGGTVFFIFLFLMFRALWLADLLITHGVSGSILAKMTLLMILSFLPTALPVAFLVATLVGFGRLSADSELVALKASGRSMLRLSAPAALLGLATVGLSLGLNLEWVPWGERTLKNLIIRVSNTRVVSSIHEGTFTSGFFDLLIFAERVDPKANRLNKVFIYDEREPGNPMAVVARQGELIPLKTPTDLGAAAILKLRNGSIHRNDSGSDAYQKIDFGEYRLYLKVDEGSPNTSLKPTMLPYRELLKIIRSTTTATIEGREMRGEFWRRISIAFSPLVFVFLGIGFGTVRTRSVRAGATLVAFVTLLFYWSLLTAGSMAVHRGTLPPALAMQLPNLVALLAGLYSFRKAAW